MTDRKIRWHRYSDHRGRTISVRAVQDSSGEWKEHWTTQQIMTVDLSRDDDEPDTQEKPVVAYRSVSDISRGSQLHRGSPNRGRATKKTNNRKEINRG